MQRLRAVTHYVGADGIVCRAIDGVGAVVRGVGADAVVVALETEKEPSYWALKQMPLPMVPCTGHEPSFVTRGVWYGI